MRIQIADKDGYATDGTVDVPDESVCRGCGFGADAGPLAAWVNEGTTHLRFIAHANQNVDSVRFDGCILALGVVIQRGRALHTWRRVGLIISVVLWVKRK